MTCVCLDSEPEAQAVGDSLHQAENWRGVPNSVVRHLISAQTILYPVWSVLKPLEEGTGKQARGMNSLGS